MMENPRDPLRKDRHAFDELAQMLASVEHPGDLPKQAALPAVAELQDEEGRRRVKGLQRNNRRTGVLSIAGQRLGFLCLLLLIILGAVAGGIYWRMSHGPLSLPFARDAMLHAIAARLPPGYKLDVQDVSVEADRDSLKAVISDVSLRDKAAELASAPRIVVDLDTMSWLRGGVAARSVTIEGAAATVNVSLDGRFTFQPGIQDTRSAEATALTPLAAMNALDAVVASAGSVDAIELKDASLAVHDQALGRDVTHRNINMVVRRTAATGGLSVALAAAGGTINATTTGSGDQPRIVDVNATNISIDELALALAPGAQKPAMKATFDMRAQARIEPDGTLSLAQAQVSSGGGSWDVHPEAAPFVFDKASVRAHWDRQAHAILLDEALVRSGDGNINFGGTITPPAENGDGKWRYDLAAPNVMLAARREELPPLKLDTISLAGSYDPSANRLGLDRGIAQGPTASVAFAGDVIFGSKTPAINLTVSAKDMSAVALTRLWPVFALADVKQWLEDHIKGGTISAAALTIAIPKDVLVAVNGRTPPLPDDALRAAISMSGGTVQVINTLPPLSNVDGNVSITGRHLDVAVAKADIETEGGDTLNLTEGSYSIPDFAPHPAHQNIAFSLEGPASAIAQLITQPPLADAVKGLAVDPKGVSGDAGIKVKLDLPIIPHPKAEDVNYTITGSIEDMSVANIYGGKLGNGDMKISIEPGLLLLSGKGLFNGLPANIDMRQAAGKDLQLGLVVTLDDAARRKKGLDFGDMLTGPVLADIRSVNDSKDPHYDIALDLTAARIRGLLPGWQKPAGKPAKASFSWDPSDKQGGGAAIENIVFDNGSISLRGTVALSADNKLRKAVMSSISLSPGDDFAGTFEPTANGFKVSLKGDQLDARPLLAMLQKRVKASGPASNVAADIQIDKVIGFNDEVLSNFGLTLESRGTTIRKLDLKGSTAGGQLVATLGTDGTILAQSPDAGAFMRFMDYYTHLRGGRLAARVTPVVDNMRGDLVMRDFSVENEAALGQYRTKLKNSGKADSIETAQGSSAKFTRLHLAFTRTASKIGVLDSVVWGPDVGVTLSGDIDYGADDVNLTGTFVPAYALNNIFGKIPVLGEILGGGQYGGLFALNFKVAGRVSEPVLTVNPLSAIAPGFLRKIFEFQKQKEG